ncbi:MAG: LysM peptidoglycan-binding domain-containing protein, partial [Gammaproteobacteria bacterium]|nr:LysM peptidoglycan-binding domain-containing protein [Gammaproteobacteria bacterium]
MLETHALKCDDTFPCPNELRRRIDFWIEVFRTWRTDQVVFHDSAVPERVYVVLDTTATCKRRGSASSIEKRRTKIRTTLQQIASKLESGQTKWSAEERHLLGLFPNRKVSEIRTAAKNVRCQQGNRDRFAQALQRYGTYRSLVQDVLKKSDLPSDIQYLPFVESAYNPKAYSRVGAAGLWQIMPRTARTLGLQLSATMDERLDPQAATWAAARYLREATEVLTAVAKAKDPHVTSGRLNPFVITSYNYGVAGMRRAINEVGPDYIQVLRKYKSRSFRTAVRNFYASFLAARYVARNAERYFGNINDDPPLRYDIVVLKRDTSVKRIREVFSVSEEQLKVFNPGLTRYVWNGWRLVPKGYQLKLPVLDGGRAVQTAKLDKLPGEKLEFAGGNYKVRKGDTACGIAQAFQVKCSDIINANALGKRALIRVGQKLFIPGKDGAKTTVASVPGAVPELTGGTYTVRKGDTACDIARAFRVDCKALIHANGLNSRGLIYVGQNLLVPGKEGATKVASTSEVTPELTGGTYTVRKGDTACDIARAFRVDCKALIHSNGLGSRGLIYVGQNLLVPGKEGATKV